MGLRAILDQVGQRFSISHAEQAWWARGDAPVRVAETLVPLVDGRAAMLAMCIAFLTAQKRIWLADWDLQAELELVRGRDQRPGPDGTPEQEALLERLRTAGLDEEALALWTNGPLRVVDVLGFAARRGVDVRVLLWGPFTFGGLFRMINSPQKQQQLLKRAGIHCRLDKSSRSLLHVAQGLHQKFAVIDGTIAFIGGVDLTVCCDGDYNRWDTPAHLFEPPDRATDQGPSPHPWHDVHLRLTGEPALDVENNFLQRWEEARRPWWKRVSPPIKHLAKFYLAGKRESGQKEAREEEQGELPPGAGPPFSGASARVQVIRTIPALTYRFAPEGIYGIAQAYTLAVRRAKQFISLETQYLWLERVLNIDLGWMGWQSHHMRAFMEELAAAARRGVTIAVILPDHPNCGRFVTDGSIAWLREQAPKAAAEGRLHFFTLGTSKPRAGDGLMRYRPIYVHAKVGLVDDQWATVGSANLNSRSLSHDAELNLAVLDNAFARGLRLSLWAEHLGLLGYAHTGWPAPAALPLPEPMITPRDEALRALLAPLDLQAQLDNTGDTVAQSRAELEQLEDPLAGIALLERCAAENLERLRREQPLIGHLLPYLSFEEAEKHGLSLDRFCGLLDGLRGPREGIHVQHPNRYL
ncbi:MAG TPA: phospholipase D family protein [Ktedonobacterales bacterium]|jgi:phosphatidylserine/phosphatidylglycerophosphate/cardiolipin synthase-like enzyme